MSEVFGELDYREKEFVCTGVRHRQTEDGSVVMDQTDYIKAFKPVAHPQLVGAPAEAETTPAVHAEFISLLGAVAYALFTQQWISVYVVALQRKTKKSLKNNSRIHDTTKNL